MLEAIETAHQATVADPALLSAHGVLADCRTWPYGLAESVGVQLACPGGSRYWPLETGHRSRAALANRRATSGRSGNCCRRPEPYAGAGTPELRPHRMRPRGPGITASTS